MCQIWNINRAAPVGTRRFPRRIALRYAAILERLFDTPYMVR